MNPFAPFIAYYVPCYPVAKICPLAEGIIGALL